MKHVAQLFMKRNLTTQTRNTHQWGEDLAEPVNTKSDESLTEEEYQTLPYTCFRTGGFLIPENKIHP